MCRCVHHLHVSMNAWKRAEWCCLSPMTVPPILCRLGYIRGRREGGRASGLGRELPLVFFALPNWWPIQSLSAMGFRRDGGWGSRACQMVQVSLDKTNLEKELQAERLRHEAESRVLDDTIHKLDRPPSAAAFPPSPRVAPFTLMPRSSLAAALSPRGPPRRAITGP